MAFFRKSDVFFLISKSPKKIFQITILNLKLKFPGNNSKPQGTIHFRRWQNFHDFWTLPPYRRQFFITIRWQIWLIFDPFPPRKCRRLKWMVLKFKLQAQDSNSEYFYFGDLKNESHFMKKATFSPIRELIILLEITRMTCKESKKPVYICRYVQQILVICTHFAKIFNFLLYSDK